MLCSTSPDVLLFILVSHKPDITCSHVTTLLRESIVTFLEVWRGDISVVWPLLHIIQFSSCMKCPCHIIFIVVVGHFIPSILNFIALTYILVDNCLKILFLRLSSILFWCILLSIFPISEREVIKEMMSQMSRKAYAISKIERSRWPLEIRTSPFYKVPPHLYVVCSTIFTVWQICELKCSYVWQINLYTMRLVLVVLESGAD